MTEPAAGQAPDPQHGTLDITFSPSRIAAASLLVFLLAFSLLVLNRLLSPGEWEFGLEVETEVAAIEFRPGSDTRWRVDGSVICSLEPLSLPEEYLLADARTVCGGRRWSGWQVAEPEQVLNILGGATAKLEVSGDRLAVSIRSEQGSVGDFSVVGRVQALPLGSALNLFWDLPRMSEALAFPFIGATTLGRAVSWSDAGMLRGGSVSVFTADESADRRTQVDQAALMLGDQVRLDGTASEVWPKGFIRVAGQQVLQVVAFGRADNLSIDRFGDSGYDFRPGWLTRLFSDPLVAFWGSLLLVYISVVLSVVPLLESSAPKEVTGRYRLLRWLTRYRD